MEHFILGWLAVYLILVFIYGVSGVSISIINKHKAKRLPAIQNNASAHNFRKHKQFIQREIKQSLKSSLIIALLVWSGLYLQGLGWVLTPTELTIANFVGYLFASMLIFDTWFYWGHRLIHSKCYRANIGVPFAACRCHVPRSASSIQSL